ncbi:MAG: hypothetical protein BSOLF_2755 [Candidatus Carbobacillus altaicus]|uniref:Uncharacterized protein n=1 Tax=Candidatus Carbonibacillus altaicus TaxID=2163959 RepID=A0A2R6Y1Z3_9BACL|nr:MAG: hypothetical protein BSOLF_2755 [Candidatus Carbobacillus altaicus]
MSSGKHALLELTKVLYVGNGAVDVADLAKTLNKNLITFSLVAL